jgi:hypothetical protein
MPLLRFTNSSYEAAVRRCGTAATIASETFDLTVHQITTLLAFDNTPSALRCLLPAIFRFRL